MMNKTVLEIDLTKTDGLGDFPCPHCGTIISPDDMSEESYRILEARSVRRGFLDEILIQCNTCKSIISIVGFEEVEKREKAKPSKRKTENQILKLLEDGIPLTLTEVAEALNKEPKVIFRSLRKLFDKGRIISDPKTRSYMLAEDA